MILIKIIIIMELKILIINKIIFLVIKFILTFTFIIYLYKNAIINNLIN